MGYVRAEDVLPEDVLQLVQEYVDGELLYVPRKGEKRIWGSGTDTRAGLKARNEKIYAEYLSGTAAQELAARYCLSVKSIQRIVRSLRR